MKPIRFEIPLKVVSALNAREHWAVRAKRVKRERVHTRLAIKQAVKRPPGYLIRVELTRVGPRGLDVGDNLASSLKGVRDQVACWLGIDDRSPLVRWDYSQETGDYAVKVLVESMVTTPVGVE